jgi:hypothetical protein
MGRATTAGQLALWVGRRGKGSASLRWAEQDLVVHVSGLQIVGVEGDDRGHLEAAFGLTRGGEWFTQAAAAVAAGQVSQAEANAVVKRALAERLREFFLAPDAEASFESGPPPESPGLTISYPHLVVEMVLGSGGESLVDVFLPEPSLLLRRLPEFPKRVGALGLTEEAMAILAKINDQRSAQEIADPSPHGREVAQPARGWWKPSRGSPRCRLPRRPRRASPRCLVGEPGWSGCLSSSRWLLSCCWSCGRGARRRSLAAAGRGRWPLMAAVSRPSSSVSTVARSRTRKTCE